MTHPIVQSILQDAVYAPSGDNSQPWRFFGHGLTIDIENIPDRDNPIFNFEQRGSFIAHGALLENISLLASQYGYSATISLFPEKKNPLITSRVELRKDTNSIGGNFRNIIRKRCTNRKRYFDYLLLPDERSILLDQQNILGWGQLLLIEEKPTLQTIAYAASAAEEIMLRHKALHDAFFSMLRWSRNEERRKGFGMFIDTLELEPPQKIIFKWFSNWKGSLPLRLLHLPQFIAKKNAELYASASAIGAIIAPDNTPESFIFTGRLLQKIWLSATSLGLSMQPIAGVLYLHQRNKESPNHGFPKFAQERINKSVKSIYKSFNIFTGVITMQFRIGKADAPTTISEKQAPLINEKSTS